MKAKTSKFTYYIGHPRGESESGDNVQVYLTFRRKKHTADNVECWVPTWNLNIKNPPFKVTTGMATRIVRQNICGERRLVIQ